MSNTITWYFDFISPFAYLQQVRFVHFPNFYDELDLVSNYDIPEAATRLKRAE